MIYLNDIQLESIVGGSGPAQGQTLASEQVSANTFAPVGSLVNKGQYPALILPILFP